MKIDNSMSALNAEIQKCSPELTMIQAGRGWVIAAARKRTPEDYIEGVIESFGDRCIPYQTAPRTDEIFRDLFILLWRAETLATGNASLINTNEKFHASDDLWFIAKVKKQLDLITPVIATPEFTALMADTNTMLDRLNESITNLRHTRQAQRAAAAQAAAHGDDSDDMGDSD